MYHPSKWGDNYYLDKDLIPFNLINDIFIELPPINIPENWSPKSYKLEEITILTMENFRE